MAQTRVVGRVSVRVMPDTRKFKDDLAKSLTRLERTLKVEIPVELNTRQLREQAVAARQAAEAEAGKVLLNIDTNTRSATTQLNQAARDRTATITPEVDRSALARVRRSLATLATASARIGGGTVAVGGLGAVAGGAAAAAGQVVQLAAALAPLTGAIAVLPAVAASAGAAMSTLRVATMGVGEAMGAALTGDTNEFAEALEGLSPAARSVVGEVRALAPALTDLQQTAQDQFFAPLQGQLTELGQRLLPTVAVGMADVSSAMGTAASEAATFAGSAQSVSFLDGLFESTAAAIRNATTGLTPFLSGLTAIGTAGLPYVEQLAAAFGSLGERFGAWATEAAEAGRITEWIDGAISAFSQLGDIVGNVGGILGSVFAGAGDGGILTTIETLTSALDDFFASADGQAALSGLFEGLSSIGSALAPVITSLAAGIGALAPAVGRIATAFGPVLTSAIDGLVPALSALEPGITAVIGALGEGIDALVSSGALETLGAAFSEILTALAPLLPLLGQLAGTVLTMLADVLVAIAPSLELLATALVDSLAPVLPELSASFTELIAAIAPLLPPLIDALLPVLDILPSLITLTAEQMSFWAQVITDLSPIIEVLIGAIGWVVAALAGLITWVLDAASWLYNLGTSARQGGEDATAAISGMRDRIVGFLTGLRDRIVGFANGVRDRLSGAFNAARTLVVGAVSGLVSGATSRISSLLSTVRGLPGRIRSALGNLGNLLRQAGRNVIQGLVTGISSMVGRVRGQMSNIAATIRSYLPFSPAKAGPLRQNPPDRAGATIAQMIADGLASGESVVASAMGGVASAASLDGVAGELSVNGGAGGGVVVQADGLDRALLEWLRRAVRVTGGGNVQIALGQGGARA